MELFQNIQSPSETGRKFTQNRIVKLCVDGKIDFIHIIRERRRNYFDGGADDEWRAARFCVGERVSATTCSKWVLWGYVIIGGGL